MNVNHPEAICEQCGRANITWFVQPDLWNKYARREDGTAPMLCPCCFAASAEKAGYQVSVWELKPIAYLFHKNKGL